MFRPDLERMSVEYQLLLAQRRANAATPYSPAWDAAMADVEEWAREAWRLDQIAERLHERPAGLAVNGDARWERGHVAASLSGRAEASG